VVEERVVEEVLKEQVTVIIKVAVETEVVP
jgi:hypothetical protein